jgi:DNA-binding Lrp family transcriptional regulator
LNRPTELDSDSKNVAYMLVKCEPGFERQVLRSLKKINVAVEVEQVYGSPYDIVVKIECNNINELTSNVWLIRRIDGIRLTQTLLVGSYV